MSACRVWSGTDQYANPAAITGWLQSKCWVETCAIANALPAGTQKGRGPEGPRLIDAQQRMTCEWVFDWNVVAGAGFEPATFRL